MRAVAAGSAAGRRGRFSGRPSRQVQRQAVAGQVQRQAVAAGSAAGPLGDGAAGGPGRGQQLGPRLLTGPRRPQRAALDRVGRVPGGPAGGTCVHRQYRTGDPAMAVLRNKWRRHSSAYSSELNIVPLGHALEIQAPARSQLY